MKQQEGPSLLLGVTGGVGAGKSTILEILEHSYGFHVIETDQVARRLMEPGGESYEAVCRLIGPEGLCEDGSINRSWLAGRMFQDDGLRRRIDQLVHPLVWRAAFREAAGIAGRPVVIESAVPAKEFRDNCQEMWYVYTSRENRGRRLMESRGYSEERCCSMIDSQAPEETYRSISDAVIDNNAGAQEVREQVAGLLEGKYPRTKDRTAT